MDVVGDLLNRDRRSDRLALRTPDGRERSYRELLTNAYKAGNALRHQGLHRGARIDVTPTLELQPVLAFLGASLLGATTRFGVEVAGEAAPEVAGEARPDDAEGTSEDAPRVRFVSVADEERYDSVPGTKLVAFGGDPVRSQTTHWETEMWSENPGFPPTDVAPDDALLSTPDERFSHRSVLDAARAVADEFGIDDETVVVVRESPSDPRVVTAGLVTPLLVGGGVALACEPVASEATIEAQGTLAVCGDDVGAVPEPKCLSPRDVPL